MSFQKTVLITISNMYILYIIMIISVQFLYSFVLKKAYYMCNQNTLVLNKNTKNFLKERKFYRN